MLKWIFNLLIIAFLAAIQTSFFSIFPFFKYFHPVLLYILYLSIRKNMFLPAAILGGYVLDLYSSYPFGLHIAAIFVAAAFTNYVYFNVITSRRFFTTIILAAASILLYHIVLFAGMAALSFLKLSSETNTMNNFDVRGISIEIISVSVAASAAYFAFYYIRKKLSSRLMLANHKPYAPK